MVKRKALRLEKSITLSSAIAILIHATPFPVMAQGRTVAKTIFENKERLTYVASIHATLKCMYNLGLKERALDEGINVILREKGITDLEFNDATALQLGMDLTPAFDKKCDPIRDKVQNILENFFARIDVRHPEYKIKSSSLVNYPDGIIQLYCHYTTLSGKRGELRYLLFVSLGASPMGIEYMDVDRNSFENTVGNYGMFIDEKTIKLETAKFITYAGTFISRITIDRESGEYEKEIISPAPESDAAKLIGKCYRVSRLGGKFMKI